MTHALEGFTIAAIATPPGRGALAVVRVSGAEAFAVAGRVVRPWPIAPRRATLCAVHHPADGTLLDRALVTCFAAPASYTGDDTVEIVAHGGHTVPASVLAALVAAGARPATPGEFTRRAVLNGRLDLVQAEAVGDLIDAGSGAMQQAALAQLDGGLSRRVAALRDALLDVEALLAYDIDFPEEDDGPVERTRVEQAARLVHDRLDALLATAPAAALVRDGAAVVIAGPPNAGKSSLFNALLGDRRAIVTAVPGTTRDAIEAVVDTRPWPLRLVDTAGLRATDDVVERLGIEVSERWLARAELVLACGETPEAVLAAAERVRRVSGAPVIGVWTKRDGEGASVERGAWSVEGKREEEGAGHASARGAPPNSTIAPAGVGSATDQPPAGAIPRITIVPVSAETGAGLRELVAVMQRALGARHAAPVPDIPLVTRARHQHALSEARAEVAAFITAWRDAALPAPVAAVHIRAAVGALDDLIGAVDVEDVLGRLFGTFCVGK